jgi:hypothetical protein
MSGLEQKTINFLEGGSMKKSFLLFTVPFTFLLLLSSCSPAPKLTPASAYDRFVTPPTQTVAIKRATPTKDEAMFSSANIDSAFATDSNRLAVKNGSTAKTGSDSLKTE